MITLLKILYGRWLYRGISKNCFMKFMLRHDWSRGSALSLFEAVIAPLDIGARKKLMKHLKAYKNRPGEMPTNDCGVSR